MDVKTTALAVSMAATLAACSGSGVPTLPYELTMNSRWIGMKQYEVARILGPAEELPSQACRPGAKLELCMAWGVNHPQKTRFLIGIEGGVVTTYDWDNGRVTKPAEPPAQIPSPKAAAPSAPPSPSAAAKTYPKHCEDDGILVMQSCVDAFDDAVESAVAKGVVDRRSAVHGSMEAYANYVCSYSATSARERCFEGEPSPQGCMNVAKFIERKVGDGATFLADQGGIGEATWSKIQKEKGLVALSDGQMTQVRRILKERAFRIAYKHCER